MPSETSVSIEQAPCRAFFSAARWNGQAAQSATGAVSAMSTHCQPGNRYTGKRESRIDRSVSGRKKISATISLRFR